MRIDLFIPCCLEMSPTLPPGGLVTCASTLQRKVVLQILNSRVELVVTPECSLDSFFEAVPSKWIFGEVWIKALIPAFNWHLAHNDHSSSEC